MARIVLDDRPIYTHHVNSYTKRITDSGFTYDSATYKRYYSMVDAEAYFGDRHIEDIKDIDWRVLQNTTPLFGYNSFVFDEMAQGSRIIEGKFIINFTSPNYIFNILSEIASISTPEKAEYTITKTKEELTLNEQSLLSTTTYSGPDKKALWKHSFDISVIFGEKTNKSNPVHTILENVYIMNCQQLINTTGEPIFEMYNFIAKDIKTIA